MRAGRGETGPTARLMAERIAALDARAAAATLLTYLIPLVVVLTLSPFPSLAGKAPEAGSEAVTYLTFAVLTAAALPLALQTGWRALLALASPAMLALLAWLALTSAVLSADPSTSVRRLVLTLLTFGLAALLPLLARSLSQFRDALVAAALAMLLLSYLGLLLVPEAAIHQVSDPEPQLAGDWRGIYSHKNGMGAVAAVLTLVGLFAMRAGRPLAGGLVAVTSLIFLLGSGGKSATGLIFVALGVAWLMTRARSFALRAMLALAPLVALNALTVGSVAIPVFGAIVASLPVDATFTGRTDIWSFALEQIAARPVTGHGFMAFWGTAALAHGIEDPTVWAGSAATSHNAYLDLALTIGLPGLLLAMLVLVAAPLRHFHATVGRAENGRLSRFFLAVWLFALYHGSFEAFFLSRADPAWFLMALSVCGLRYASLGPIRAR
jgi:O-antigen ligase